MPKKHKPLKTIKRKQLKQITEEIIGVFKKHEMCPTCMAYTLAQLAATILYETHVGEGK